MKIEIVRSDEFTDEEVEEIKATFPKDISIKDFYSIRQSEFPPPLLMIVIKFAAFGVGAGLFNKIGSDIWDKLKEKIIPIILKERGSGRTDFRIELHSEEFTFKFFIEEINEENLAKALSTISDGINQVLVAINNNEFPFKRGHVDIFFDKSKWEFADAIDFDSFRRYKFNRGTKSWDKLGR